MRNNLAVAWPRALLALTLGASLAGAQTTQHYETSDADAPSEDQQEEQQEEQQEAQPPAPRPARVAPRVFRARPGGTRAEPDASTEVAEPDTTISGDGQSLGGQGMGPAPTAGRSCAWTSEISPTPTLHPTLPCSSANEGDVSPNSQNHGSFTCICDSGRAPSPSPAPSPSGPGKPATTGDLCAAYGLPNTIEVPKAGNVSKDLYMPANGAYVFTFTTGAAGTSGSSNTQYSTVSQAMTISKYKCDFSQTLKNTHCGYAAATGHSGAPPFIRWRVIGGRPQPADVVMCFLEPNTKYYVNLMDAVQDPAARRFISTCPGGKCGFRFY